MRHATLAPGSGDMDNPTGECSRDQKKIEEKVDAGTQSPASDNASAVTKRREFVRLAEANHISLTPDMWVVFEALLDLEGATSHCAGNRAALVKNLKTRSRKDGCHDPASRRLPI